MADKKTIPDPLTYNIAGLSLTEGSFFLPKSTCIDQMRKLVSTRIGGEFLVKIETWQDKNLTSYDVETKKNINPIVTSFQVWVPKSNAYTNDPKNSNVFLNENSVNEYTLEFKKFVNTLGISSEGSNVYESLGKKKGYLIVCLDPNKLFGVIFDANGESYEREYGVKINKPLEVRVYNVYEGDDPIAVAHGNRRGYRNNNLIGFVIGKTYRKFGNGDDKYRPPFNSRRRRYD